MRQKTKKLLSVVLSLSMAFSVMPLTAYAADESASGGESGAPVLRTTTEPNSTTTSGPVFDFTTTDGSFGILFNEPINVSEGETTDAAYDFTVSSEFNKTAKEVTLILGKDMTDSMANDKINSYTVNLGVAEVKLSRGVLDAISTDGSTNGVVLAVKNKDMNDLTDSQREKASDSAYVLDISLQTNADPAEKIDFNGDVEITIPSVTTTDSKYFTNGVNVYYLKDDGSDKTVIDENPTYNSETGELTFTTSHFSLFPITGKQGLKVTADSSSVRVGRTLQLRTEGSLSGGKVTYTSADESIATVDDTGLVTGKKVGNTTITVTSNANNGYEAESYEFALTVTRSSNGEDSSSSSSGGGGGSSSSGYSVNVSSASNGTVSVDKDRASSGSTVTITAEPDEGYVVGSVTVTDSDGNEITVRDRGNNEYTFTMPSSRVTIEVEFVEDTTVEEPVDEITEADFSDVSSSDWFYDAVNYVFSKGIMVGVTENSFAPNSSLTRAMIVQMLYSLEGSPEVTGTAPFTDVAIGQWYTNAITWAASNNIVSGMGDGTFAPNNNITREQLAMILYNYAQLKGNAVTASGNLAAFTDGNEVSDWAETAVRWAVGEGLMSGRGNGVLDPTETTTRAEAASMFMRFMESDLA